MNKVIKIKTKNDLVIDIKKIIEPIIGNLNDFIKPTDRVLLKPNFNTADPFPASTSLDFLGAVIKIVKENNPQEIIIGESCTYFLNTEKICRQKMVPDIIKEQNITWHNFEKGEWVKTKVPGGKHFKSVSIPKLIQEVDKIILLPPGTSTFTQSFFSKLCQVTSSFSII